MFIKGRDTTISPSSSKRFNPPYCVKGKQIRWCGFDVDGTLRDERNEIPADLIKHLDKIHKMNSLRFFLASGRSLEELVELNKQFGNIFSLLCAENGGIIYNVFEEKTYLYIKDKDEQSIKACVDSIKQNFPYFKIILIPKQTVWSGAFGDNLEDVYNFCRQYIEQNKLSLNVYAHYGDSRKVLDIVPIGIDKTNLLYHLELNPKGETILYFGDASNDSAMLEDSRVTPCTVDNAQESIKKLVAERNGFSSGFTCGDGVLDTVQKVLPLQIKSHL